MASRSCGKSSAGIKRHVTDKGVKGFSCLGLTDASSNLTRGAMWEITLETWPILLHKTTGLPNANALIA